MDVRMPGMDGIEATRRIVAGGGRSRVLVLTTFDLDEYAHAALRAGASGFLLKDALPEELLAFGADLTVLGAPLSEMVIFRIGQGVAAVPDEATAFSHRDARYLFHPICVWADPSDDSRMIAAGRAFATAMRPSSTGASYLDFTPEALS